jgi:hypothetical protein
MAQNSAEGSARLAGNAGATCDSFQLREIYWAACVFSG